MSYNVEFKVKVEGAPGYVPVGYGIANVTWNAREIIVRSTGLPWVNEANNGLCSEIMPKIQTGLKELRLHPEKYKPYESPNGWGSVAGTKRFFQALIDEWNFLVAANPELAAVATFWIA